MKKSDIVYMYGKDIPGYDKTKEECIQNVKNAADKSGLRGEYVVFECRPVCVVKVEEVVIAVEKELDEKDEKDTPIPALSEYDLKDPSDLPF